MVSHHRNERDDRTENAENGDPYGVSPLDKEVWIESNFSPQLQLYYPKASILANPIPSICALHPEGVYNSQILWMGSIIPADYQDEPLKHIAATFDGQEYQFWTTKIEAKEALSDVVLEAEMSWMEWEDLDDWELIEISDLATISQVEFDAEIGLKMMEIME